MNFNFAGKTLLETNRKEFCPPVIKKKENDVKKNNNNNTNLVRKNINKTNNLEYIKCIEKWIVEDSKDVIYDNIMIQEVQCLKPGCVPIETVIVLSIPNNNDKVNVHDNNNNNMHNRNKKNNNYIFKIFKPLKEVILDDILNILNNKNFSTEDDQDNIHLIKENDTTNNGNNDQTPTIDSNTNNDSNNSTILELTHEIGCPCCDINSDYVQGMYMMDNF